MITQKCILATGAAFGCLAVMFGAFGAHGLKDKLEPNLLASFETGVKYQFYHALLLLQIGLLMHHIRHAALNASAVCVIVGTLLFSGSIYLLATRTLLPFGSMRFLGPVTPLGGVLLIAGWFLMALAVLKG